MKNDLRCHSDPFFLLYLNKFRSMIRCLRIFQHVQNWQEERDLVRHKFVFFWCPWLYCVRSIFVSPLQLFSLRKLHIFLLKVLVVVMPTFTFFFFRHNVSFVFLYLHSVRMLVIAFLIILMKFNMLGYLYFTKLNSWSLWPEN